MMAWDFFLEPHAGETYTAKWKDEQGVNYQTPLPAIKNDGVGLEVKIANGTRGFLIKVPENTSANFKALHIVANNATATCVTGRRKSYCQQMLPEAQYPYQHCHPGFCKLLCLTPIGLQLLSALHLSITMIIILTPKSDSQLLALQSMERIHLY
jgi:hypothetical protein